MLILQVLAMSIVSLLIYFVCRKLKRQIQIVVAYGMAAIGLVGAVMIGTTTELVLPGIGGIAIGAAGGAFAGYLISAAVGTLGVVTGGMGFAVGAGMMSVLGAALAAVGATAGGIGLRVTQTWIIAMPVLIVGLWMILNRRQAPESVKPVANKDEVVAQFSKEIGLD